MVLFRVLVERRNWPVRTFIDSDLFGELVKPRGLRSAENRLLPEMPFDFAEGSLIFFLGREWSGIVDELDVPAEIPGAFQVDALERARCQQGLGESGLPIRRRKIRRIVGV